MSFNTRRLGISMNQGDDFELILLISDDSGPINLTGYEFFGDMKLNTDPLTPIAATFSFSILNQTTNTGQVQWTLDNEDTAALIASTSDAERKNQLTTPYVFDVKMQDTDSIVSRIVQGIIYLSPQVTIAPGGE